MSGTLAASLAGALRLLGGDRRGLERMDLTLDGFWASFRVMAWLIPAVALAIFADLRLAAEIGSARSLSPAAVMVAGVINYVLGWIAFPVFLALFGNMLGVGRVYVPWMVARNWVGVPASLPYVLVVALWLIGLMPTRLLGPLTLGALGFSLFCGWRVAVLAGERPAGAAVAFTLVDFLLGLLIEAGADRLLDL